MTLLFLMGGAARAVGDFAEAQSLLENARNAAERAQPESREAGVVYHALATFYLDRQIRFDEAKGLLEHASTIAVETAGHNSTEYAGSLAQLAVLLDTKGEFDRAVSLYREAFRVYDAAHVPKPGEHADFLTDAAGLYLRLNHAEDALAAYKQRISCEITSRSRQIDTG